MKIRALSFSIISAIAILLSACSDQSQEKENISREKQADDAKQSASGDIREETKGLESLPVFLKEKPEDMQMIYSAAAKNKIC